MKKRIKTLLIVAILNLFMLGLILPNQQSAYAEGGEVYRFDLHYCYCGEDRGQQADCVIYELGNWKPCACLEQECWMPCATPGISDPPCDPPE